jgi:hypothetical protein
MAEVGATHRASTPNGKSQGKPGEVALAEECSA